MDMRLCHLIFLPDLPSSAPAIVPGIRVIIHAGILIMRKTDVNEQKRVMVMAETKGHFEKGVWVEEKEPVVAPAGDAVMDKRLSDATTSVKTSVDDAIKVVHDLVTTEEGKQYIEKTMKDVQSQLEKSFDEILRKAKEDLAKNAKPGKK